MDIPGSLPAVVFWLLAGLALFLYGIDVMSNALRKAAGPAIRRVFDFVAQTRFHGLLVGIGITGLIQSSSASTVMVVGFINAGLLKFGQSIGIILGSNIGATITPQITAFNLDDIALPLIAAGFLFTFLRKRFWRLVGLAVMGFGMLFFGLLLMKFSVRGYQPEIQRWLSLFVQNNFPGHVLAFLVALAATAVIQSSAATVAMIQVIAVSSGGTGIGLFFPMIVGAQIGTCITAMLASIKSSLSARRAAVAHLVFNLIGAVISFSLYSFYLWLVPLTSTEIPRQIANYHVFTRLLNVLLFLPFTPLFARLVIRILPGEDKLNASPEFLDFKQVHIPQKALESAEREILRMYETCLAMLEESVSAFIQKDSSAGEQVLKRENLVDDLYRITCEYLLRASRSEMGPDLATQPALWMHLMSDVERIGDHAENIVELCTVRAADPVHFSPDEIRDINETLGLVLQIGEKVRQAMQDRLDEHMSPIIELKERLNTTVDHILDRHAERLEQGTTTPTGGILFVEVIMNLRRVANHLRNIAASITSLAPEHSARIRKIKDNLY